MPITETDASAPGTPENSPSDRKYNFTLPVDENGKAKVLKLYTFNRPHMRAFHFAWFSFFLAFFGWFALAPLQKGIRDRTESPWLTKDNFRTQNIIAVLGTIIMRLTIGPFCDRFGPRLAQSSLLSIFSIPVFLVGTSQSFAQWATARFFIGFIGAAFVVTQFWTSIMFSGNIVGTANATSGGWGNLGGGVTQAVMPQIFNGMERATRNCEPTTPNAKGEPQFLVPVEGPDGQTTFATRKSCTTSEDKAWRLAMIFPGVALIVTAVAMWFLSDDLPDGNYAELHKAGKKEKTNPFLAMRKAATNWRVWILFLLYAGCFGIELVMNGNLATYFSTKNEPFQLEQDRAGLVASLFGLMNLFARSLGGIFSDVLAAKFAMRGRLWSFFVVQLLEGILFIIFSRIRVLGGAIPCLIGFSLFVQMAEGATFAVVPFVDPPSTGAISGIVGAGGNFGAVIGNLFISDKRVNGISDGFRTLGFIVVGSAFLIPLLWWPQHGSMIFKARTPAKVLEDDEPVENVSGGAAPVEATV